MPEELGFEAISVAVPTHGDDVPTLVYRPLTPMDVHQCRELHAILFPIQYEEDFFTKTVNGCDGEAQRASARRPPRFRALAGRACPQQHLGLRIRLYRPATAFERNNCLLTTTSCPVLARHIFVRRVRGLARRSPRDPPRGRHHNADLH